MCLFNRELEKHINKLHLATQVEIEKIAAQQDAQDKVIEEKLQEVYEKLSVLDAKMSDREARLESMLAQLTILIQQKKE